MVYVESKVGRWRERENVLPPNDEWKSVRCEGDDGDEVGDDYECDGQKQK